MSSRFASGEPLRALRELPSGSSWVSDHWGQEPEILKHQRLPSLLLDVIRESMGAETSPSSAPYLAVLNTWPPLKSPTFRPIQSHHKRPICPSRSGGWDPRYRRRRHREEARAIERFDVMLMEMLLPQGPGMM